MINLDKNTAHLNNGNISYIIEVDEYNNLLHRYFGPSLKSYNGSGVIKHYRRGFATQHDGAEISYDNYPIEYPVRSNGDFRIPALEVIQENGVRDLTLKFKEWQTVEKPELEGLPSIREGESETLEVTLEDETAKVTVKLYYTIYPELGIITRSNKIENNSDKDIRVENFQSASLELEPGNYEMLTLFGMHCKEGSKNRFKLHNGIQKVDSNRGVSSHHNHPFMAIMEEGTNNTNGNVYAMNLAYSGNFEAATEVDSYYNVRSQMGMNPEKFSYLLKPGESLWTPEVILNFSSEGLNGMAHNFHKLYKDYLIAEEFNKTRPLLFNSWEGTYFNVSEEKTRKQAEILKDLGVELYVLDDGWFRNDSRSGMGDWEVIEEKLPNGIEGLADIVKEQGLKFGLWFEPEAVGDISKTIEAHPDWALQLPEYPGRTTGRHELLLDLTRKDVRDHIINTLSRYLDSGKIDYIKWDMNRALTDYYSLALEPSEQGKVARLYVEGLYEILDTLTKKYPEVLFEGCASGGGRFDPGVLPYFPQVWTSDNTDAYDRMEIQDGMSLIYPPITMSAHVSVAPNHQTGRYTPLKTRFDVARLFNFGYEIDVTSLDEAELEEIKDQVEEYKKERDWLQHGTFYHHDLPNDNYQMISTVSEDKDKALGIIFQKGFDPRYSTTRFKFLGLDPDADYEIEETGEIYSGDELMKVGITVGLVYEDYHTFSFHLTKKDV